MKHVYLAGPFFSNEPIARLKQVESCLAEDPQPLAVYAPRLYQESSSEPYTPKWAREVFEKDMLELTRPTSSLPFWMTMKGSPIREQPLKSAQHTYEINQ